MQLKGEDIDDTVKTKIRLKIEGKKGKKKKKKKNSFNETCKINPIKLSRSNLSTLIKTPDF